MHRTSPGIAGSFPSQNPCPEFEAPLSDANQANGIGQTRSPDVEARVCRTRRRPIQDALRAECRLALRTREEAQDNNRGTQIPVEVSPGHPAVLKELEFPDDFERILLLGRFRSLLEQAQTGASGLVNYGTNC